MKIGKNNFLYKLILIDTVLFVFCIFAVGTFDYIIKKQVTLIFLNENRNYFLTDNMREINKNILGLLNYNGFSEVDINQKVYANDRHNSRINNSFLVTIHHELLANSKDNNSKIGTISFKYSFLPSILVSLVIWALFNFIAILLFPLMRKHVEKQTLLNQEKIRLQKEAELALQLSHDIRAPLETLNIIFENLSEVSPKNRYLFSKSLQRINNIASSLLYKDKDDLSQIGSDIPEIFDSVELIKEIVNETRIRIPKDIIISLQLPSTPILIQFPHSDFLRILSNLINNCIEAFPDQNGSIIIKHIFKDTKHFFVIEDNGKGIPKNILMNIGQKGFSYEKNNSKSGTGLGIYHAKKVLEKYQGGFQIESEYHKGTLVTLSFPQIYSANSTSECTHILLDNDPLVRSIWEFHFQKNGCSYSIFEDYSELKKILPTLLSDTRFYIDYHLNSDINGIDVITQLHEKGFRDIYLMTGHSEEEFKDLPQVKSIITKKPQIR